MIKINLIFKESILLELTSKPTVLKFLANFKQIGNRRTLDQLHIFLT